MACIWRRTTTVRILAAISEVLELLFSEYHIVHTHIINQPFKQRGAVKAPANTRLGSHGQRADTRGTASIKLSINIELNFTVDVIAGHTKVMPLIIVHCGCAIDRRIFIVAYALLCGVCLLSFAVFNSSSVIVLAAILLASLALSFLEPISNLFFFSKVTSLEEEKAYPTFVTADLLGGMLAKGAVGVTLILFNDKVSFLSIAVIIGFVLYNARRLKT